MRRTKAEPDDAATAERHEPIDRAGEEERARNLTWLQENADAVLDFDVLEANERAGR